MPAFWAGRRCRVCPSAEACLSWERKDRLQNAQLRRWLLPLPFGARAHLRALVELLAHREQIIPDSPLEETRVPHRLQRSRLRLASEERKGKKKCWP